MRDALSSEERDSYKLSAYTSFMFELLDNITYNNPIQKATINSLVNRIRSARPNSRARENLLIRLENELKKVKSHEYDSEFIESKASRLAEYYSKGKSYEEEKEIKNILTDIKYSVINSKKTDALYNVVNKYVRLSDAKAARKEIEERNAREKEEQKKEELAEEERRRKQAAKEKAKDDAYEKRMKERIERENNRKKVSISLPEFDRERSSKFKTISEPKAKREKPVKENKNTVFDEINIEVSKGQIKYISIRIVNRIRNLFEIEEGVLDDRLIEDALKIYANIRFLSGRINKNQMVDAFDALYDLARDIPSVYAELMSKVGNDNAKRFVNKIGASNWPAMYAKVEDKITSLYDKLDDHEKELVDETKERHIEASSDKWFYYPQYVLAETNKKASSEIAELSPDLLDRYYSSYYLPLYYLSRNMNYDQIADIYKRLVRNDWRVDEDNHKDLQGVFIDVLQERIDAFDPKKRMVKSEKEKKNEIERAGIAKEYLRKLEHVESHEVVKEHMKFKGISSESKEKASDRFFGLSRAAKIAAKISKWGQYKRLVSKEVLNNKEIDQLDKMFGGR